MTETWYLLYAGTTADGMGDGNYCGRTTDKEIAKKHWEECKRNPYSVGKVIAVTDTKHRRIGFDYEWDNYESTPMFSDNTHNKLKELRELLNLSSSDFSKLYGLMKDVYKDGFDYHGLLLG